MIRSKTKREVFIEIISFIFMTLFVYVSVSKLMDFQKFSVQISQSPLLTQVGNSVGLAVIIIEMIIPVMLAVPKLRIVGFFAAFTMMVLFTAYILVMLRFSDYIPCSCGGILELLGWNGHLVLNIVLSLLALTGIMLLPRYEKKKISSSQF